MSIDRQQWLPLTQTQCPSSDCSGAHTSPFDTALGSAQVCAGSVNFVKDKAGHTGLPGPLRGQGDTRLSQKINKKMKKCLCRAIKVTVHSKCFG